MKKKLFFVLIFFTFGCLFAEENNELENFIEEKITATTKIVKDCWDSYIIKNKEINEKIAQKEDLINKKIQELQVKTARRSLSNKNIEETREELKKISKEITAMKSDPYLISLYAKKQELAETTHKKINSAIYSVITDTLNFSVLELEYRAQVIAIIVLLFGFIGAFIYFIFKLAFSEQKYTFQNFGSDLFSSFIKHLLIIVIIVFIFPIFDTLLNGGYEFDNEFNRTDKKTFGLIPTCAHFMATGKIDAIKVNSNIARESLFTAMLNANKNLNSEIDKDWSMMKIFEESVQVFVNGLIIFFALFLNILVEIFLFIYQFVWIVWKVFVKLGFYITLGFCIMPIWKDKWISSLGSFISVSFWEITYNIVLLMISKLYFSVGIMGKIFNSISSSTPGAISNSIVSFSCSIALFTVATISLSLIISIPALTSYWCNLGSGAGGNIATNAMQGMKSTMMRAGGTAANLTGMKAATNFGVGQAAKLKDKIIDAIKPNTGSTK